MFQLEQDKALMREGIRLGKVLHHHSMVNTFKKISTSNVSTGLFILCEMKAVCILIIDTVVDRNTNKQQIISYVSLYMCSIERGYSIFMNYAAKVVYVLHKCLL